jgi:nitrate/TMAO reductase-like tetraheme cytochrome c subunit
MYITAKETENKCRKCHDLDNDPHFDMKKWEKIKHGREGQTPHSAP